MEVFNTRRLNQQQRFTLAVLVGFIAAIVLGYASGKISIWIARATGFGFAFINIGAAYLLALVIQKVGRGVQERFSILGAVLAVLLIIVAEFTSFGFPISAIINPDAYRLVLKVLLGGGFNSILTIIYNGIAIYTAYSYSRFI